MLIRLYDRDNDPSVMDRIKTVLENGGIVIYPTDTMYAIGCHALKERAVEKICRIKDIDPKKNNLSIICYDLSEISRYARIDNATFKLMKKNLPGPFTFILEGTSRLPKIFRSRKEIGVRMPANAIIMEISRELDAPILTSTIPYDEDEDPGYATDPELIYEKWGKTVDITIDGGQGSLALSTVIDCTSPDFTVIRQGAGVLEY